MPSLHIEWISCFPIASCHTWQDHCCSPAGLLQKDYCWSLHNFFLAQGNHWSGHSLKVTWCSALILLIADDAVLRNIFSAGISVWSCHASSRHLPFSSVWSCHASRDTRLWAANPLQNKGYGSLWQPGDGTLRGTAGAEDLRLCFPETLGGIKSQWFLCLGPLLGGT